jgi:tetratricopeptide (TPR) repeat protein
MSDPLRTESSRTLDELNSDRDAKIERLLLAGLDHYFAAEYEQAINIWTRALFLDRGHARARAYIERARSALAEEQRQSEELLHSGLAAFDRGEADEARRLLKAAVVGGAPADEALSVLERLDRLQPASPPLPAATEARRLRERTASPEPAAVPRAARRAAAWRALGVVSLVSVAALILWGRATWPDFRLPRAAPAAPPLATPDALLPAPTLSETAFARARALSARGHFHDALTTLDRIRPTDPEKADADQLRAALQRQLIELATTGNVVSETAFKSDGGLR